MAEIKERLRKSSLFNTYGPGAVYETSYGHTVVIQSFEADTSDILNDKFIIKFLEAKLKEIGNVRSPAGIGIFIIKDFDEKGEPAFKVKARRYFEWLLVSAESDEGRTYLINRKDRSEFEKRFGKIKTNSSVRFIGICENGHMQDLPWEKIVHGSIRCSNRFFIWEEKKGDIAGGLKVKCPECGAEAGLEDIYNVHIKCEGKIAERGGEREECDRELTVTLKTASDVYIPESIIFISAHPFASEKFRVLIENDELRGEIEGHCKYYKDGIGKAAENIYNTLVKHLGEDKVKDLYGKTPNVTADEICNQILPEIRKYLEEAGKHDVRYLEFDTFYKACDEGYPPVEDDKSHYYLLIDKHKQRSWGSMIFQPVEKMTFYRVLFGYRRTSPSARLVPLYTYSQGKYWFAAASHITEGLFITFKKEKMSELFDTAGGSRDGYGELFAFMHTLSHAVIRFFGEVSGYSEASLRERIYFFPDKKKAGLLIFALSESSDGAAGGLTSAVTSEGNINNLVNYIREKAFYCSRDPVCFETETEVNPPYFSDLHSFNRNEGVCHACMFISETSCEFANKGLSRKILQKYFSKKIF